MRGQRRTHLLWSAIVGATVGFLAIGFQLALKEAEMFRTSLIAWLFTQGWGAALGFPILSFGIISLVAWGTRKYCPEAAGSGIPHLKGVLIGVRMLKGFQLILVKFFGGILAIGSGLSLGREGPTVQMGGAIGNMFAKRLGLTTNGGSLLIAVGAGAGLSAAFNAPLAGFLFVIEELHFELASLPYLSALTASIMADMVSRLITGQSPSLVVFTNTTPPLDMLPWFGLLGLAAGFLSIIYKTALIRGVRWTNHHQEITQKWLPILVGGLGGFAVLFLPEVAGSGQAAIEDILNGNFGSNHGLGFLFILLVGKFGLNLLSYLVRVPGGIFAPMLMIGGVLGYGVGVIHQYFVPGIEVTPAVFAVIGMAGFFSGVVHAPLTGIALIIEMTGNFKLLFPMMFTTLIAFGITEWWGEEPIYEALLTEDLRNKGLSPLLFREPVFIHVNVEYDSELAGKRIDQMGLPEGILIISINRLGHKFVPSGKTILTPGDNLEILISGEIGTCSQEIRELAQARATEEPADSIPTEKGC